MAEGYPQSVATPDVTARTPARGPLRAAAAVESIPWLAVMRIAMGALFISVFFDNLNKDLYAQPGYGDLINGYSADTAAPAFWSDGVMGFVADNGSFFAPAQAIFELGLAVALILGIATGAVALITAGHLLALWVSQLGIFWVWEIGLLIIVAVVVGLAALPRLLDRGLPFSQRILGPPAFTTASMATRLAVAVAAGATVGLASLVSNTGGEAHDGTTALETGVALALLIAALGWLDRRRDAAAPR